MNFSSLLKSTKYFITNFDCYNIPATSMVHQRATTPAASRGVAALEGSGVSSGDVGLSVLLLSRPSISSSSSSGVGRNESKGDSEGVLVGASVGASVVGAKDGSVVVGKNEGAAVEGLMLGEVDGLILGCGEVVGLVEGRAVVGANVVVLSLTWRAKVPVSAMPLPNIWTTYSSPSLESKDTTCPKEFSAHSRSVVRTVQSDAQPPARTSMFASKAVAAKQVDTLSLLPVPRRR